MCYVEGKRKLLKQSKETEQRWNAVADAAGLPQTFIGEHTELTDEQSGILRRLAEGKGIDKVDGGGERIPVTVVKQIANLMLGNDNLRGRFDHQWLMTPSGYTNFYDKFGSTGIMGFVTLGQYKGKGLLGITPFSLQSIAPDRLDELFNPVKWAKEGGLRQFSYEDARPIMFFDYFQQMMLLQAAHAPLQLYTKREMMPDLFGETGAMINQSLVVDVWNGSEEHRQMLGLDEKAYDGWLRENAGFIPKGVLDGSGDMETLVPYYSKDSFPIEAAMRNAKDARFGGRVGNAVVAPSDAFIRWALDNPDIHQILAYHAQGTSPVQRALVGYDKATQYDRDYLTGDAHTNVNDVRNGIVVEGGKLKWNTLLRKYQREGKGAREAAQFYLDYCKENGIKPMFEKFADHPEYYKLLVDFRAYDEQGNSVKQKAVKATLPEGWQEKLSGYLGEQEQATEAVQGIASNKDLQRELQQATKYVSLEPAERETIEKILGEIYGKENVFMLGGEEFDKALDAATEDGKANALRDAGGVVYGFTVGGKIYLSTDLFNAHTPLHEHGHIYMSVLEQIQPKLHQRGIELWKGTDMWEKIRQHLETLGEDTSDSHILSELAAQFTGKENEKVISEMTGITDKNWLQRAMNWLNELWAGVKSAFSKWTGKDLEELTPEQFISMPFRAFYDPKERAKYIKNLRAAREMGMAADMEAPITKNDDAAYKEAVKNGDMETAQKMVDEAAKKAMPNTKVVDESGNPLVVFHGTTEDFTVFDHTKARTNMDIQGMFFSPWELDAKGYGGNTRGFYVNITNPASFSVGLAALRKFQGQDGAGTKAREYLIEQGYDGVNNDNEEYIAFYPEQIKSADAVTYDDNGNVIPLSERFNKENNDIRYHFVGEQGAAEADRAEGVITRIESLANAKQMEAAAKDESTIKAATGWERGEDRKWRYEITDDINAAQKGLDEVLNKARKELRELDNKAEKILNRINRLDAIIPKRITSKYSEEERMKIAEMRRELERLNNEWVDALREQRNKKEEIHKNGVTTTLVEVLGDDYELFKYYPDMKDMPVNIVPNLNFQGEYHKGKITLKWAEGMESTLLHEMQHAIQRKEGFAKGGNMGSILNDMEVRDVFIEELRNEMGEAEDMLNIVRDAKSSEEAITRYAETGGLSQEEARVHLDSKENKLLQKIDKYNELFEMLSEDNVTKEKAFEYYQRIAGEVEARNVQARAGMTAEERRESPASYTEDIERGEQIVTYGDAEGGKLYRKPTLNDYYLYTDATFEPIVNYRDYWNKEGYSGGREHIRKDWEKLREYHPDWEYHKSPKYESESEYLVDKENGDIYRFSDHWGKVATCNWRVRGMRYLGDTAIAKANINDFKRNIRNEQKDREYIRPGRGVQDAETSRNGERLHNDNLVGRHYGSEGGRDGERGIAEGGKLYRDSMFREGGVLPTYEESLASSKAAGYTKKQHDAWWNRAHKNMRLRANDIAKKLHLEGIVDIYETADDLNGVDGITEEDKKSKGWYDPKTGRIAIILGNHASAYDVMMTMLHEGVAHFGLRQLFGKNFETFLWNVYSNATPEVRSEINKLMAKNGWNYETATEEYLAGLAEDTDFERADKSGWWWKIKDWFVKMLRNIGLGSYVPEGKISDNELRYVLWRSYQNLVTPGLYSSLLGAAIDVAKQYELGVGKFAPKEEVLGVAEQTERTTGVQSTHGDEFSIEQKDEILKAYQRAKDRFDAVALVNTPTGYVLINDDAKLMQNSYGLERKPYVVFGKEMLDEVMRKLIRKGHKVSISDIRESDRFAPKLHRSGDGTQEAYNNAVNTGSKWGMKNSWGLSGYNFREAFQDSMLALRKLQEVVEERYGIKLGEDENAYDDENSLSSRNQEEKKSVNKKVIEPMNAIVDEMISEEGVDQDDLNDYLICKHGLERNVVMAERDARKEYDELVKAGQPADLNGLIKKYRNRDYSGLTGVTGLKSTRSAELAAMKLVYNFENNHSASCVKLWEAINKATKWTLKKGFDSGMMSKETYDKVRNMFQYYVPLRGWDEETAEDVYDYLMNDRSVFNGTVVAAKGHRHKSDDPLAIIANMADSAILQGNRNQMKQKLLNMAVKYPTDVCSVGDMWIVKNGKKWAADFPVIPVDASSEEVAQIVAQHDADMRALGDNAKRVTGKLDIEWHINKKNIPEHAVVVNVGGVQHVVYINGNPRAAQAVNGLTGERRRDAKDKAGRLVDFVLKDMKRWYSSMLTQYNINFSGANYVRDFGHSILMTFINNGPKDTGRMLKYIFPAIGFGVKARVGKGGNGEYDKYYKEFLENGGVTGYAHLDSVDKWKHLNDMRWERLSKLQKAGVAPAKVFQAGMEAIGWFSETLELITRFNTYIKERKKGESIANSVKAAKNITVNFNKKGSEVTPGVFGAIANTLRLWKMFFNPIVQGLNQIYEAVANNPKARNRLIGVCGFYAILGAVMPFVNMALVDNFGDDDDDYFLLNEYTRRTNFVFFNGKGYVKIPLPQFFREFYGMGEAIATYWIGEASDKDLRRSIVGQIENIFSIEGQEGYKEWSMTRFVLPEQFDPVADVENNENFMGTAIWNESIFKQGIPEYQKAKERTWKPLVGLAKEVNELQGGTENVAGEGSNRWNANPAAWQHLLENYGGGLVQFIGDATNVIKSALDGEMPETSNMPFAKRFYTIPTEESANWARYRMYKDFRKDYDRAEAEHTALNKENTSIAEHVKKIVAFEEKQPEAASIYYAWKDLDIAKRLKDAEWNSDEYWGIIREAVDAGKKVYYKDDKASFVDGNEVQDFEKMLEEDARALLSQKYSDGESRKLIESMIAKKHGAKYDEYSSAEYMETEYGKRYYMLRTFDDLESDNILAEEIRNAKEDSDDVQRKKALDNARRDINTLKQRLGDPDEDDEKTMREIRERRRDALKEFGKKSKE
jgi:hypothetical protein